MARHLILFVFMIGAVCGLTVFRTSSSAGDLPRLDLPDPDIARVYLLNWTNTLGPCRDGARPTQSPSPHVEPERPWKVDVNGHYPGWYPGVDVKHQTAAYLACTGDLPLVLRGWELTTKTHQMPDGGVRSSTMHDNPQGTWPEATADAAVVYYPLRSTATIDYLLTGDIIFRFSQDKAWLGANLPHLRRAARFLEGWIDEEGIFHSDSYDLDQVYREIDGVALASAYLAFQRLATLEEVTGHDAEAKHGRAVAQRLAQAAETHFWDQRRGYYAEHLVFNNVARVGRPKPSSERDGEHAAENVVDGILGIGVDAFGVGSGAGGRHEWAAKGETVGASITIAFDESVTIGKAILFNRTDPSVKPGERFARGRLEFSDGSPAVDVTFNDLGISRAVATFTPRTVTSVRFVGTAMHGDGGEDAGLAEFMLLAGDEPYRKVSHGMTDTNLAMVAFGVASKERAATVWRSFKEREDAFYQVDGLRAPTWISERAETYTPEELNRRAPRKDCVAMARIWRYDALMRQRMGDGDGLHTTIQDAHRLIERPSGGGVGYFAERYGLGKFQPGDEAQATVPKYAGYPAIYNSTIVQQTLLGLDVDAFGTVTINPCVPTDWYESGFGIEGCHLLKDHRLAVRYGREEVSGSIEGPTTMRSLRVALPPALADEDLTLVVDDEEAAFQTEDRYVQFNVQQRADKKVCFMLRKRER